MSERCRSWLDPVVARRMWDFVQPLLDEGRSAFKYFLLAMEHVRGSSLVDAGCGVGHYSEVLFRHYPDMKYTGFDFSEAMIERARLLWPGRQFLVADMLEFDYGPYDVVLASGLVGVLEDWREGVEALCKTARGSIVFHRPMFHDEETERLETTSYGQPTYAHIYNEGELLSLFEERSFEVVWSARWADYRPPSATYVLSCTSH